MDLNAGYRYLDTKLDDDNNIKYRGFLVGLTYRFGGHKAEAAPVVEEPAPVVEEPVQEPAHVYNDYYLDSIHFASDDDQPLPSERDKMDHLVQVAKDHPDSTFKLVGNTDSDASDAYNEDLSKRRVDHVAQYVSNNGVSSDRLKLNYKGEKDPVASNATEQGKAITVVWMCGNINNFMRIQIRKRASGIIPGAFFAAIFVPYASVLKRRTKRQVIPGIFL